MTPLHYACEEGHTDVVGMLISEFQANVNDGDIMCGQTPLHYACKRGQTDVIRIFEFQANVNCRDLTGKTPLYLYASDGNINVWTYTILVKKGTMIWLGY